MTHGDEARRLFRCRRWGMLATLSSKLGGHPFGSLLPYLTDHAGCPLILVSQLAEHTKNIEHDARVSLLVHEGEEDVQQHARATLVGRAIAIPATEALKTRQLRYFPEAQQYFDLGDFRFYRIEPDQVRYIGGFGAIRWISSESFLAPPNSLADDEEDIVAHMNQDHAHNLRDYCRRYCQRETLDATMIAIDCDGFNICADGTMLRLNFPEVMTDATTARIALVAMAKASKP